MAKKRTAARPRKQKAVLRPDVKKAIERIWPDGIVDMTFDPDESYFCDIHQRLKGALERIKGAQLLHEHAAKGEVRWFEGSDPDEDPPDDIENSRSYHLFFICPEGEVFTFETEIEDADEVLGAEEIDEVDRGSDDTMTTVPGQGWRGWSVAVSLLAPFAVITLSEMSQFDDGSSSEPGIELYIQTEEGDRIHPEEHFRKFAGEHAFEILKELRGRISGILERNRIIVLPEEEWRKEVSWLRGGEEVFVGAGGEPLRVLDAFFFEGL